MKRKCSAIFALGCLAALTAAFPDRCSAPNCNDADVQAVGEFFPHSDPKYYWECVPVSDYFLPHIKLCGCGKVFNANVGHCTLPSEDNWQPACGWSGTLTLNECE